MRTTSSTSVDHTPLPIDEAIPELRRALAERRCAVLQAPPGAGKTTRVPLVLLGEGWLSGRRIIMLEPRRLATRAAAHRMAATLGERVGERVGFRVRMETRVTARTRIEVVTEGVLTRMLHDDPGLDGVGLVIFDEFHERHLHADLGLALTRQTQRVLRDDLRILVMSATLDGARVAKLLDDAPVISASGRMFSVDTRWIERRSDLRIEGQVAQTVRAALNHDEGDVLVFLPGASEIHRVGEMLRDVGNRESGIGNRDSPFTSQVDVIPLFGNLPQSQQDQAIQPSIPGRRKVVLSTSIAESSLTIDGVRVVVDSGLSRVPRFSPRSGMTELVTVRVSRASADQRRGRAGRVASGVCYRLWAEHEEIGLVAQAAPEILQADLAPLILELAAAGVRDPSELDWLDEPPAAACAQARELLGELGALDHAGRITRHGTAMVRLAMHPRLAHMLLSGVALGAGDVACDIAALLSERDVVRGSPGGVDADMRWRVGLLRPRAREAPSPGQEGPSSLRSVGMTTLGGGVPAHSTGADVDPDAVARVRALAGEFRQALRGLTKPNERNRTASSDDPADVCGLLLAFAYPDRIGQRRAGQTGRYLLRNGAGAALVSQQALTASEYVVVAELDGQRPESRVFRAAPITIEEIEEHFADQIELEALVEWDPVTRAVVARERRRLGAIALSDIAMRDPDPDQIAAALIDGLRREGIDALPWGDGARRLRERLAFMRSLDDTWPDVSNDALTATLGEWLAPHVGGVRKLSDLSRLDLVALLLERLTWRQRAALDELAPTHFTAPSGSRIPIDYSEAAAPVVAVRLQEMFGLAETPTVGGGRVPITLHLLSPAHRPVQVTRDLAGFWRTTYFEVKKEMKGRYPKHVWPDNPMTEVPTRRAKPRGT